MLVDTDFTTRDRSEADEMIRRVYPGSGFEHCSTPFTYRQRVLGDDTATIALFAVSSRSEVVVDLDGMVGIGSASGGDYRVTSNGEAVHSSRGFILPPGRARSKSTHHRLRMVNLRLEALRTYAGAENRRDRLRFGGTDALSDAGVAHWSHVARHATRVFSAPSLSSYELMHRATVDLLLASALDVFEISLERCRFPAADTALPNSVRRGIQFIEDNPAAPIGVHEIAEASRVSVRGLQMAFRKTLDMTPLDYLRRVRLSEAHRELQAAAPDATTVTDVSRRWGFTNSSRFAHAYREEFGETPRQTLQR